MTIRNLEYMFRPGSVAIIGASNREGSIGAVVTRNLLRAGLAGPVMPVNPKYGSIQSVTAYPDVESLPAVPDLAVIATPPHSVPGLIAELGARGTKAAVVITAGVDAMLRQAMLDAAKPHLLRIVGPNCLGVMAPPVGLNAGFSHIAPGAGRLAFVTQSGAIVTSIVDWAAERDIGFSHLVSLGDMSDVDFGDMLDYLANDRHTSAILLYIEAVTHARKFMSAARAAARSKPVIVVKSGRFAESARAAASHTGALAGSDEVYDAAFRRAGMLRVYELEELFDAVETLGKAGMPRGDRLTILTNGGGMGVMATDTLIAMGGRLADIPEPAVAKLDAVLPSTWSKANPVDIIGDAPGARYADALRVLLSDVKQDAVLVLNSPTAIESGIDAARAVVEA
ncbi:MAG: CoA-binding protein, partial [Rhodospirillaceae bacterium]